MCFKIKDAKTIPFLTFLLLNTIYIILLIVFLSLLIYFLLNITPFPERFTIGEMTQEMIDMGQDKSLIIIYAFIACARYSLIGFIITSIGLLLNLFSFYDLDTSQSEQHKTKLFIVSNYIGYFLFSLFYFVLFIFLIWYIWFIFIKENTRFLQNKILYY